MLRGEGLTGPEGDGLLGSRKLFSYDIDPNEVFDINANFD